MGGAIRGELRVWVDFGGGMIFLQGVNIGVPEPNNLYAYWVADRAAERGSGPLAHGPRCGFVTTGKPYLLWSRNHERRAINEQQHNTGSTTAEKTQRWDPHELLRRSWRTGP